MDFKEIIKLIEKNVGLDIDRKDVISVGGTVIFFKILFKM